MLLIYLSDILESSGTGMNVFTVDKHPPLYSIAVTTYMAG